MPMRCQNEIPCSNFRKQREEGGERRKGNGGIGCARAMLANMAQQPLDPFERIWPIKRGLRAALSSGLTQSMSFLSSRPLLSLSLSPFFRLHIIPWLCVSHTPPGFLPPRAECFSRDIHDRSNRWARDNGPLDTFRSLYGPPFPREIKSWWFSDRDFSGGCSIYSRQDTPSCCGINSSRVGQSIWRSISIFRKRKMFETLSFYI